jgi:putative transposase
MITSSTWGRRSLFGREPWARLLIDTLYHYRGTAYLLHEFVVMPDHIHVILAPLTSLEKAVQFIKGGFSYRAKKELGSNMEVWQKGFSDHRIRDVEDYLKHVSYVRENPVRKHLCERAEDFPFSSAFPGFELDPVPQGLKPPVLTRPDAARLEGAPFQNNPASGIAKGVPAQTNAASGVDKGVSLQTNAASGAAEAVLLQHDSNLAPEGKTFQSKPIVSAETPPSQHKPGRIAS